MKHPIGYHPSLMVNTTNRCNYRCRMCFYSRPEIAHQLKREDPTMPMELFERAMAEAVPRCRTLCLAGAGEFLLDPLWKERIPLLRRALTSNPIQFFQTTNASLLTTESLSFLEGIETAGFTISLDVVDDLCYASIRRPGKCGKTMANIWQLRSNLAYYGVTGIEIQINVCLMKRNILFLPKLIEFAREVGAKVFIDHYQGFGPDDMQKESLFYHPVFCNLYLKRIRAFAQALGVNISLPPPFAVAEDEIKVYRNTGAKRRLSCYQLDRMGPLQINQNGDVSVCCVTENVIGNLNEQSFDEIFNSPKYDELRSAIAEGRPRPPCDTCRHLYREAPYLYESSVYQLDIPPELRSESPMIDLETGGFLDWIDEIPPKLLPQPRSVVRDYYLGMIRGA